MLKKILLSLVLMITLLILTVAVLIYKGVNYPKHPIKTQRGDFSGYRTDEDFERLADSLVSQMSLDEKLAQMWGERPFMGYVKFIGSFFIKDQFPHIYVGKNDRLKLPPWVLSDGPRGAVVGSGNTAFPVAMARGASWDVALERKVADVIGKEVRANGTNYNAAPCINILMHPAWGRAQETYGEDQHLLGAFAVAYIQSIQRHHVMACPKHYAANNIENSRFYVNVEMDERTLREVYLPHFQKAVQEGKPASIMSAYNQFRGDFVSHSKYLLTDILRDEWGFKGFVTSDWINALRDGLKGVKAGMDIEMPFRNHYGDELENAIRAGKVTEEEINLIVKRILKTRLKYAILPDLMMYDHTLKAKPEHMELAREVAEQSMVLLKNDNVLPFDNPNGKKVLVLGKIADMPNIGDKGSSNVRAAYVITPYQGVRQYVEKNGGEIMHYTGTNTDTIQYLSQSVDQVIVVVGFTHEDEGEFIIMSTDPVENPDELAGKTTGGDRKNLSLKAEDVTGLQAAAAANKSTIVALVAGSAVMMEEWRSEAPAILYAWYAGSEGGNALAHVLYGQANPSGKLPFTVPTDMAHLHPFDPWAKTANYEYYHGYARSDKFGFQPAFHFGYGLSYTKFEFSNARQLTSYGSPDSLYFEVTVSNIGEREGATVAQLYIGFSNSQIDRPVKLLKGFKKLNLDAKSSQTAVFSIHPSDLAWYNTGTKEWEIENMVYEYYIGSSADPKDLIKGTFTLGL